MYYLEWGSHAWYQATVSDLTESQQLTRRHQDSLIELPTARFDRKLYSALPHTASIGHAIASSLLDCRFFLLPPISFVSGPEKGHCVSLYTFDVLVSGPRKLILHGLVLLDLPAGVHAVRSVK